EFGAETSLQKSFRPGPRCVKGRGIAQFMNRRSFLRLGMLSSAAAFATVPRALAVAEPAWTVTVDFFHAGTVPYHQGNGCSPAPSHQLLELCDGQFLQRERL